MHRQQSASHPEHAMAVNIHESILEVQQSYLKQLAADENHALEFAKSSGAPTMEFEKNRRKVERVIEGLWSSERTTTVVDSRFA